MTMNQARYYKTFITVIVASLNSVATLRQCIESFSSQSFKNKELIIIDGGSNDQTKTLLKENNKIINYWVSEPDCGIANAWNKALKNATGEWIIFLGSDDIFASPTVLEEFSKRILEHSIDNGRIIYGEVKTFLPGGEYLATHGMDWSTVSSVFFSEKMMIPHQACFHHCSVFKDFGSFDENYVIAADYEFLLRVLRNETAVYLPGLVVTNMTFGGISSKVTTLLSMQIECDNALRKNGFNPSGYKRTCNVIVYKVLGLAIKFGGEKAASKILDTIRGLLGKNSVWTRK